MNITVYLGSNDGKSPTLRTAVRELGSWIGSAGHTLIYGGSKRGLMGDLAESVLQSGGHVIGVEPRFFVDMGLVYPEIDELIVTEDMSERKAKMVELGDAFIAFPGGTGTLEEISEIMSKVVLGHLDTPCMVYNLNGYYDTLASLLDKMVEEELALPEKLSGISFVRNLDEIKEVLARK